MKPVNRKLRKLEPIESANGGAFDQMLSEWVGKLKESGIETTLLAPSNPRIALHPMVSTTLASQDTANYSQRRALPAIGRKYSEGKSSNSSAVSATTISNTTVSTYSQTIVADGILHNKLNSILLHIGKAVELLTSSGGMAYDISTRGRIDNLLGPLELQSRLVSMFNIRLMTHDVQILMKRFGNSGVSGDRADINEIISWARSTFEKNKEHEQFEVTKKKTQREVRQLMARNNVLSKIERNKILEAEFQKKIELKLSLAALDILNGNDKSVKYLENTDTFISSSEFKDVLGHMGIYLSNLEFSCLLNAFLADDSQHSPNSKKSSMLSARSVVESVNFDGFRGYMMKLLRESAKAARQERAVDDFKNIVTHGNLEVSAASFESGTIAESEEEYLPDESFDLTEIAKLSSDMKKTEKALENKLLKRPGHQTADRNTNSIRILYDDSISIQEEDKDAKRHRNSSLQLLENRSFKETLSNEGNRMPKPTVNSVVDWISDPLNSFDGKRKI